MELKEWEKRMSEWFYSCYGDKLNLFCNYFFVDCILKSYGCWLDRWIDLKDYYWIIILNELRVKFLWW